MLKVGLTGGLASGKTFVGEELARLGCLLIQADELGHEVLEPGGEAYAGVVAEFGAGILTGDGRIDRALAARIFRGSAEKLAAFDKRGSLLVGDVDPLDVAERAGAYSPVPGGVGPLTIAMLMMNTVAAAERRAGEVHG